MTFGRIHLTTNSRGSSRLSVICWFRFFEDARRFGLKARHLGKHQSRVDRFYRDMITGRGFRARHDGAISEEV